MIKGAQGGRGGGRLDNWVFKYEETKTLEITVVNAFDIKIDSLKM